MYSFVIYLQVTVHVDDVDSDGESYENQEVINALNRAAKFKPVKSNGVTSGARVGGLSVPVKAPEPEVEDDADSDNAYENVQEELRAQRREHHLHYTPLTG